MKKNIVTFGLILVMSNILYAQKMDSLSYFKEQDSTFCYLAYISSSRKKIYNSIAESLKKDNLLPFNNEKWNNYTLRVVYIINKKNELVEVLLHNINCDTIFTNSLLRPFKYFKYNIAKGESYNIRLILKLKISNLL
jgi:hypothetical protein